MTLPTSFGPALADRYRIERELGAGGMATVYLAEDVRHRRKVALKVLHPELSAVLGPERFLKEIELTAALQHPHILPLFDSGEAAGQLYYVMPYVEGETLRGRLERERQLPLATALQLAREVADALQYAHDHGVIHRDIKPENILLQGGHALVADFGIALAVQQAGGARMTQTGMSLGTPQYMAPEQAMGERTVDARADVYALGAVTYEMLTGEPPFTGATTQAIVAKVMAERPTPPSTVRDTVTPGLEAAVLQALAKLPADRFGSAREFAAALEAQAAGGATIAAPRGVAGSRWALPAMSAITLAAVLTAVAAWRRPAIPPSDEPRARFRIELSPNENDVVQAGAISPDGQTYAFALADSTGERTLWIRRLDSLASVRLPGTAGARDPFWSPDGQWVGYFVGPRIRRLELRTGRSTVVADVGEMGSETVGRSGRSGDATWMEDGGILFSDRGSTAILRVPAEGGAPVRYLVADSAGRESAVMMPRRVGDGRHFTFVVNASSDTAGFYQLWLAEIGSPTARRVGVLARYGADAIPTTTVVTKGRLLTLQGGDIVARPLDLAAQRLAGAAQALVGGEVTWTFDATPRVLVQSGNGVSPHHRMLLLDRSGRELRQIGDPGDGQMRFFGPRFSLDGRRIAFEYHNERNAGDLHVFDLGSGRLVRQTLDDQYHNGFVAWAPDSHRVVFHSTRNSGLWIKQVDGPPPTPIAPERQVGFPSDWGPDGTILFGLQQTGGDVWRTTPDGKDAAPVLDSPAGEMQAVLSPDGKYIAYASDEQGGRYEVYLRRWPLTPEKWRLSEGGGEAPRWRRDGRELFFVRQEPGDPRSDLMSVDFASEGSAIRPGVPHRLFRLPMATGGGPLRSAVMYDVAPDGQRVVAIVFDRVRTTGGPAVQVYLNWASALAGDSARR